METHYAELGTAVCDNGEARPGLRPLAAVTAAAAPAVTAATAPRWSLGLAALACLALCATFVAVPRHPEEAHETAPAPTNLIIKDLVGGPGSPLAKQVVVGMDTNVNEHIAWNDWKDWKVEMAPWWTEDFIYDFNYVGEWGFGPTQGLRAWYEGEHLHFNAAIPDCQWFDVIRAATNETCTSASYGIARWSGPFAGVPPPPEKPWVRLHDLDFYLLEGNKIKINWCIIDVINLFNQVGYHVVPPSPLPELGYKAPNGMDGYPAPMSAAVDPEDTKAAEKVWRAALQEDYVENTGGARWWADDMVWYGPGGVGTARSRDEYKNHFLDRLHSGFSGLVMNLDLLVCEGGYCGAHFRMQGNHTGEWYGEAATGKAVTIRCGAHAHVVGNKIIEGWLIIDQPRAFRDMGVDLYARAKAVAALKAKA